MIVSKENITTSAVGQALYTSTRNVGKLCTSEAINPWAKYKPVLAREECPDRTLKWWQGSNGKCGLNFNLVSSYTMVENQYANKNNWKYDNLINHAGAVFRLADFAGYDSEATAPVSKVVIPGYAGNTEADSIMLTLMAKSNVKETELSLADISAISNAFFGAYIYKVGGGGSARATASTPISKGGNSVSIKTKNFSEGNWTVVPFLSLNDPLSQDAADPVGNQYVSVPLSSCKVIKIVGSEVSVEMTAKYSPNFSPEGGDTIVDVSIRILSAPQGHLFTNNIIQLRKGGQTNPAAPFLPGEQQKDLTDWTYDVNNQSGNNRFVRFENLDQSIKISASIILKLDGHKNVDIFTCAVMKKQ